LKIHAAESSIHFLKSWYKDPDILFHFVFDKIKSEFPGFFNFSSESLNKHFSLRLVECLKDFVKVCNERIFPKISPSPSSSDSTLDREIISTLQNNLRKTKEDEKMEVLKDTPAKDLVDG